MLHGERENDERENNERKTNERKTMSAANKRHDFAALVADAAACDKCPAMCERRAVLSELNGKISARIMFVAEAPGRQGGDRTGVPLDADASGANFNRFINSIDLARTEIFITNAALCNPRSETGANRTPLQTEINNCSNFLQRQLNLINPRVVVTLGRVSLDALRRISYHHLNLREHAGQIHEWNERLLVPLYHPSPQVLASHRRAHEQLADYQAVRRAIEQTTRTKTLKLSRV